MNTFAPRWLGSLKFWKMGTKMSCSRSYPFGWLSGAPLCSVSGPRRAKSSRNGVRMERLSHSPGLSVANEKSALSKAGSGPRAPGIYSQPWWRHTGQGKLPRTVQVEAVPKVTQWPPLREMDRSVLSARCLASGLCLLTQCPGQRHL